MRNALGIAVVLLAGCTGTSTPGPSGAEQLAVVPPSEAPTAQTLGGAYAAYALTPASGERQRAYFHTFPDDYATLRNLFGFEEVGEDSVAFGQYYEQGNDMIGAFFKLDSLPAQDIAAKAIGIARNGVWQADGVGYFQHFLMKHFEGTPTTYLGILKSSARGDQAGFWKFYADGPEAFPQEDKARLRGLLANEPGQLAVLDSVLAMQPLGH